MLNFETRTGPIINVDAPTYPTQGVPDWYRDAKLGFFVHWGLYSVPAWGTTHGAEEVPVEDAYRYHQYAEWYGNTVRINKSPTKNRHESIYGVGTSYEDLADLWDTQAFDAAAFVANLIDAGAQYIIPTTKHHEGFCLWDTETTSFNSARRGPRRDLIAEISAATRAAGTKFGVYFSGALDWHVSNFPAIESDTDLFRFRRNDSNFAKYSAMQMEELIVRFSPDVLWNDIDWPDAGKANDEFGVAKMLTRYFEKVPDGVVNDRWGVPYHGFLTREYRHVDGIMDKPWESTRGLGASFGYNQDEGPEHTLSGAELIRHLVDVVSKNGNLLINIGPRADGTIPALQLKSMQVLGQWMRINGASIYGTRPWVRANDNSIGAPVSYTQNGSTVFALITDPTGGIFTLAEEFSDVAHIRWLGGDIVDVVKPTASTGAHVLIPGQLLQSAVAVAAIDLAS